MPLSLDSARLAVAHLTPAFDDLSETLTRQWARHQFRVPRHLYHYTTTAGLLAILRDGRIWATNTFFLNDRSEITYGVQLINEALDTLEGATTDERTLLYRIRTTFNGFEAGRWAAYVACFCEDGDLLSQWRAYGGGGGWALGLHARLIGQGRVPDNRTHEQEFALRKVIYDRSLQVEIIQSNLAQILALFRGLRPQVPNWKTDGSLLMEKFCEFTRMKLTDFLICFKHHGFREEQEWRAIAVVIGTQGPAVSFRARGPDIVPYVSLDLSPSEGPNNGRLPISTIVHGPTAQPNLAALAAHTLLKSKNLDSVEVVGSVIPYGD